MDRLIDGRPVFKGKMFGFEGEIIEATGGTIVYADECKGDVPKELLSPPTLPNQCVWHVCRAPPVGETVVRTMTVYVPLFGCQGQAAAYTFTSVRSGTYKGTAVTVGKALITFGGVPRTSWESYIKEGEGEVFAERQSSVTTYERVSVTPTPYSSSK